MQPVLSRHVFYLAGLDPAGAKSYRRLYARQAALQQSVNDCEYKVAALNQSDPFAPYWDVETRESNGVKVATRHHYLRWDDLLKTHWPRSDFRAMLGCLIFLMYFLFSGALIRLWQFAKRFAIVIYSPLIWIAFTLLLDSVIALLAWQLGVFLLSVTPPAPNSAYLSKPSLVFVSLVALAMISIVNYASLQLARQKQIFWLARVSIFVNQWGLGRDALLEPRWALLASKVKQIIQNNEADEYLVVGHCAGSIVAVSVVAYLLEEQSRANHDEVLASRMKRLQLLTLGQIVPMLNLYKGAHLFREQLGAVAGSSISWFDLNSPHDALSCGLAGPLAASNLSQSLAKLPATRSARFDQMMPEADYRVFKKDILQVHFQYLMATKFPVFNDYFTLTAGSKSLADCCARQS